MATKKAKKTTKRLRKTKKLQATKALRLAGNHNQTLLQAR